MRVLVLQHIDSGNPWFLGDLLDQHGGSWRSLRIDLGEKLPEKDTYDAVWVLGGAMQVWEEETLPWLVEEKRFIRELVERDVPYLGICLGHQLLATSLGGRVAYASNPEIGVMEVERSEEGHRSKFLSGLESMRVLQWHKAEVKEAPAGAKILAASNACEIQALSVNDSAFSVQFHPEVNERTLPAWFETVDDREDLIAAFGDAGEEIFKSQADSSMRELNKAARRLFQNWWLIASARISNKKG